MAAGRLQHHRQMTGGTASLELHIEEAEQGTIGKSSDIVLELQVDLQTQFPNRSPKS
jgi:hypothetical protein